MHQPGVLPVFPVFCSVRRFGETFRLTGNRDRRQDKDHRAEIPRPWPRKRPVYSSSPQAERTGAETRTVFRLVCSPCRRRKEPAGRAEPSAFPTNAPYMWEKEQSRDKERRRAREKGTGLVRKKRRSKEPRRYQPGLSSVLFVHGSSPGVQYSHSGEPLNNSIFDDTAINGSFFFEANYVHCMGISCFRSFLLRNRCRND